MHQVKLFYLPIDATMHICDVQGKSGRLKQGLNLVKLNELKCIVHQKYTMSNGACPPIITKPGTIFDNKKPKIAEIFTHNTIVFELIDGKDIGIRGYSLDLENSKAWPTEIRDQAKIINRFNLALSDQGQFSNQSSL